MPLLAAFIGSLFTKIVEWIGTYLTKRAANYVAMTVTLAAAIGAVYVTIQALVAGIVASVPAEVIIGASWFVPAIVDDCIAARVGSEIAIAGYRWHRDTVRAAAAIA